MIRVETWKEAHTDPEADVERNGVGLPGLAGGQGYTGECGVGTSL